MHSFVIGEVFMGSVKDRRQLMSWFSDLPLIRPASDAEVRALVDRESIFGTGVGYLDAHLLAAALLTPACLLWTVDVKLHKATKRLGRAAYDVPAAH